MTIPAKDIISIIIEETLAENGLQHSARADELQERQTRHHHPTLAVMADLFTEIANPDDPRTLFEHECIDPVLYKALNLLNPTIQMDGSQVSNRKQFWIVPIHSKTRRNFITETYNENEPVIFIGELEVLTSEVFAQNFAAILPGCEEFAKARFEKSEAIKPEIWLSQKITGQYFTLLAILRHEDFLTAYDTIIMWRYQLFGKNDLCSSEGVENRTAFISGFLGLIIAHEMDHSSTHMGTINWKPQQITQREITKFRCDLQKEIIADLRAVPFLMGQPDRLTIKDHGFACACGVAASTAALTLVDELRACLDVGRPLTILERWLSYALVFEQSEEFLPMFESYPTAFERNGASAEVIREILHQSNSPGIDVTDHQLLCELVTAMYLVSVSALISYEGFKNIFHGVDFAECWAVPLHTATSNRLAWYYGLSDDEKQRAQNVCQEVTDDLGLWPTEAVDTNE